VSVGSLDRAVVPGGQVSASTSPFLRTCQQLWAVLLAGVVALAAVVTFLAPATATLPAVLPATLAVAIGAAGLVGVLALERLFAASPPADDGAALAGYRTRLVLQAVTAEATVALTVVLAFVVGPAWVAAVGGAFAATALLLARPSSARFRRLDAAWAAAGAEVSLVRGADSAWPDRTV
jgi:hypothetical protein